MKKETFKEIQKIEKHFNKEMKQKTLAEKIQKAYECDCGFNYYEEDIKQSIKQFDEKLKEVMDTRFDSIIIDKIKQEVFGDL